MNPTHVLVPLDGSPLSEDALAYALRTFEGPITVLNVVTPLDAGMSEGGLLRTDDERERLAHERAERLVTNTSERLAEDASDRAVETAVESGDPAEAIVEHAEREAVDQIVMGGHGSDPTPLPKRLLGTVATTVVAEAPITVTVVRS